MSHLLKNLFKYSLFPASLMVISKIAGIVLAVIYFDLAVSTYQGSGFFSFRIFIEGGSNTELVNSVADLTMLSIMTLFSLIVFLKYYLYINSENNPKTIVKLAKFNMLKWVTSKESAFIKVFAWSLFLLATAAIVTVNSLMSNTFTWIASAAFLIGILNLWFLLRIFEFELSRVYPNSNI